MNFTRHGVCEKDINSVEVQDIEKQLIICLTYTIYSINLELEIKNGR